MQMRRDETGRGETRRDGTSEDRYLAKLSELVLVHSVVFLVYKLVILATIHVILRIALQSETVWLSAASYPSCGIVRRRAM